MTTFASLAPFVLVFFVFAWLLSATLAGIALRWRDRLRRTGPRVERMVAAFAIFLPVVLGGYIALALAGSSLLMHDTLVSDGSGTADHCTSHSHLHLCLVHGDGWLGRPLYAAALLGLVAQAAVRLGLRVRAAGRSVLWIRRLCALSTRAVVLPRVTVLIVPTRVRLCFLVPGRRPRIVVSSAAWEMLSADEQAAVIEHELAHFDQADTWVQNLLDVLSLLGVPRLGRAAFELWRDATERLCDARAAAAAGEGWGVAGALLKLTPVAPVPSLASFGTSHGVESRVQALLGPPLDDRRVARRLRASLIAATVTASVLITALVDPLHHAIETLLG